MGCLRPLPKWLKRNCPFVLRPGTRIFAIITASKSYCGKFASAFTVYDWDYIEEQLELYQRKSLFFRSPISLSEIFELICSNPFDRDWFLTLKKDQDLFEAGLVNICIDSLMMLATGRWSFRAYCTKNAAVPIATLPT